MKKPSPLPPGLWNLWHNTDPHHNDKAAKDRKYLRTSPDSQAGEEPETLEDRYWAQGCLSWTLWWVSAGHSNPAFP